MNKKDKIKEFNEKKELCNHLYNTYLQDDKGNVVYNLFHQVCLAYPYKYINIAYTYSQVQEISPFIIFLLEEISECKDDDLLLYLHDKTQTDEDILKHILADFFKKGYIIEKHKKYMITSYGLSAIQKKKERQIIEDKLILTYDMITNEIEQIYEPNERPKVQRLNRDIHKELREETMFRPDIYSLDQELPNGSLYRNMIIEKIKQYHKQKNENEEIEIFVESIDELELFNHRTYEFYHTLCYTNKDNDIRYIVVDNKNEIDENKTNYIEPLSSNISKIIFKDKGIKEKEEKISTISLNHNIDIKDSIISSEEHPAYLKQALNNAQKYVIIVSPWIRYEVLEIYKNELENALKRKIIVQIYYGIGQDKKNQKDKNLIDKKAKEYLVLLQTKYKNLKIKDNSNTHSKILICDNKWAISGSFNWLSFSGKGERKESGYVFTDTNRIKELREKEGI